jgi:hypothetical protein
MAADSDLNAVYRLSSRVSAVPTHLDYTFESYGATTAEPHAPGAATRIFKIPPRHENGKSPGDCTEIRVEMPVPLTDGSQAMVTAACPAANTRPRFTVPCHLLADTLPTTDFHEASAVAALYSPLADHAERLGQVLWQGLKAASGTRGSSVNDGEEDDPSDALVLADRTGKPDRLVCAIKTRIVDGPTEIVFCRATSSKWPELSTDLSDQIRSVFGQGTALRLGDAKWGGVLNCGGSGSPCSLTGLAWEPQARVIPYPPSTLPPPVVEAGAVDDGEPLPAGTQAFMTEFPDGKVNLATYRATEAEKRRYMARPEIKNVKWDSEENRPYMERIKQGAPDCSLAETVALDLYKGATFEQTNPALRAMRRGKIDGKPLNPELELIIKMTASGINCAEKASLDVIRGAQLSEAKLARYAEGKTVVERAFTSTSMSKKVAHNFVGNVEFHIRGQGAPLTFLYDPEDRENDENELLINAGTLFKVLARDRVSENKWVITMQQVP